MIIKKENTDKEEEEEGEDRGVEIEEMEEGAVATEASGDETAITAGVVTGTLTIGKVQDKTTKTAINNTIVANFNAICNCSPIFL